MKCITTILAVLAVAFAMLLITADLYGEEPAGQSETNAVSNRVIVSDASVFGDMTEAEIIAWLRAPTDETVRTDSKPPVQVVVIEVADDRIDEETKDITIPAEYLDAGKPQPEWYEWVDPRLFVEQWTEWWSTETNATPVVLVLIRF